MRLYSSGGKRQAARDGRSVRGGRRCAQPSRGRRFAKMAAGLCLTLCGVALAVWLIPNRSLADTVPPVMGAGAADSVELTPLTEAEQTAANRTEDQFLLSFAGDCTLGTNHGTWGKSGSFPAVMEQMGDNPFSGVRELFTDDDFTFVNLECALTDYNVPAEKTYRFRGLPAYGAFLTDGGIEAVTLANNHSLDYGKTGLADTRRVLEELGVAAGGDGETFLYTTQRGLIVGVYTAFHLSRSGILRGIESLKAQGAEVIVTAFHAGTEGDYTPNDNQRYWFRYAAECGAHIVYNSHPHVLQPMEYYGESLILYSMGNFCFGGNRNPSDKDTAIVQVLVERQEDGSVRLKEVTAQPCSVSSRSDRNDYHPTLYEAGSTGAGRVERKLSGSYRPPVRPAQTQEGAASSGQSSGGEESASSGDAAAGTPSDPLPPGDASSSQEQGGASSSQTGAGSGESSSSAPADGQTI